MTVSIYIPLYNKEKFIERTVNSVLAQTYKDFELVISDNGSTDNSLNIVKAIKDPRIKIITNPGGINSTLNWNNCVKHTNSDLIALFHADDIYEPNIIEEEVKAYQEHPELGAVFTRAYTIDGKDLVTGEMFSDPALHEKDTVDFNDVFKSYIETGRGSFVSPTMMAPRKVYETVGLYNKDFHTSGIDYDLYFRIAEKYPVKIINDKLLKYRIHSGQDTKVIIKKNALPDAFFVIVDKFISSPSLTRYRPDKTTLKNTYMGKKKDLYTCSISAYSERKIKDADKYALAASRIFTGITDVMISLLIKHGMSTAARNVIIFKYGS